MKNIKFEFEAIGTHWIIDIKEELPLKEEALLIKKIKERISMFDMDYSRFREDSLVTKMSKKSGQYILSEDADKMISIYKKMYDITSGLVTPLIGQVLSDAGYDANYSLKEKSLTKPLSWSEVLTWKNPKLILKFPVLLDFGACGKGYLVDIVSEIIEKEGITSYCVDAGGDMRYQNAQCQNAQGFALRIGLENPLDTSEVIGVVNVLNQSLCGSAGNRRAWGKFHHIINPKTLSSPREISAVWVIADDTITADILTTGLFFSSPKILLKHFKFEYFIVYSDFSIKKSIDFKAEIFTS